MSVRFRLTAAVLCVAVFALSARGQEHFHRTVRPSVLAHVGDDCNGTGAPPADKDESSDFPDDIFSLYERRHGAFLLNLLCVLYCFITIAYVCNDFFLPSVDCICQDLNLSKDIAGATFMAFATSAPELCVNVIGTFLTESDLGIGTVVGSAVFNTLGVAACGGLAATSAINLEVWPIFRDCGIYTLVVVLLTGILWDGLVMWYEALALVLLYVAYCLALLCQSRLHRTAKSILKRSNTSCQLHSSSSSTVGIAGTDKQMDYGTYKPYFYPDLMHHHDRLNSVGNKSTCSDLESVAAKTDSSELDLGIRDLWSIPEENLGWRTWWLAVWPVAFLLAYTVPDCRRYRRIYPLTFLMCILWIGVTSYLVSWMMTILGETFGISDSVMGLTLVAIGGAMPEASAAVINAKLGIGSMSISNALGGNTLDILLSLGLPWLIKTQLPLSLKGGPIRIESSSLVYNNAAQIICVVLLLVIAAINKFRMDRRLGIACLVMYLLFIVFIVCAELNLIPFLRHAVAS